MKIWNRLAGLFSGSSTIEHDVEPLDESGTYSVRHILLQVLEHVRTLGALFVLELEEAAEKAKIKLVRMLLAAGLLIVGYLILCGFFIALMNLWVPLIWSLAIIGGIHFIAGGILLYAGMKVKLTPVLPATLEEINTDYTCLQIAIKENRNY